MYHYYRYSNGTSMSRARSRAIDIMISNLANVAHNDYGWYLDHETIFDPLLLHLELVK